jgi:Mce-associated membrane protein
MTQARGLRVTWWALVIALAAATVGTAVLGARQMQVKGRQPPPGADRVADREAATQAASSGAVKILSYSPDTLDQDFAAAESCLTADFLAYYKQFTNQIVRPAAQQKRLATSATVVRAGVQSLASRTASILLFVNQTTTSNDAPSPTTSSSSVLVELAKVNGTWLIAKLEPV